MTVISADSGDNIGESLEREVKGERGAPLVDRIRSLQSRVSSILAAGLMILLGLGLLVWYYRNAMTRQERISEISHAASQTQVQDDTALPALGNIEAPPTVQMERAKDAEDAAHPSDLQPPPELPLSSRTHLESTIKVPEVSYIQPHESELPVNGNAPVKTPAQVTLERRLSGAVFSRASKGVIAADVETEAGPVDIGGLGSGGSQAAAANGTHLSALLQSEKTPTTQAKVLPGQRLLLPKGAFIDCTLETAIDSTLPGMTTCVTATDTFGGDGKVVLLERGTKLIGETRGLVQQGTARLFVLWTEARTPTGVVVPLDSPGTDELGRSGLEGTVDRHFWDRFGAAILVSTLDGVIQGTVQSQNGAAVIYNPVTTTGVMTEVLKGSINIPPTITKHNGDRIQILVARDLDFRKVYELRVRER